MLHRQLREEGASLRSARGVPVFGRPARRGNTDYKRELGLGLRLPGVSPLKADWQARVKTAVVCCSVGRSAVAYSMRK